MYVLTTLALVTAVSCFSFFHCFPFLFLDTLKLYFFSIIMVYLYLCIIVTEYLYSYLLTYIRKKHFNLLFRPLINIGYCILLIY